MAVRSLTTAPGGLRALYTRNVVHPLVSSERHLEARSSNDNVLFSISSTVSQPCLTMYIASYILRDIWSDSSSPRPLLVNSPVLSDFAIKTLYPFSFPLKEADICCSVSCAGRLSSAGSINFAHSRIAGKLNADLTLHYPNRSHPYNLSCKS